MDFSNTLSLGHYCYEFETVKTMNRCKDESGKLRQYYLRSAEEGSQALGRPVVDA